MNFEPSILDEFTPVELRMLKTGCLESLLFCARVFFRRRDTQKLIINIHHVIMCHVLDQVHRGNIKRLIINIPPGYTKTELAVIFFIIKGLLINARAKFLHTSYSADLALVNSGTIKELIQDPLFQTFQPMQLKFDTKAKARWYTQQGGGMMAAASGGQVTGFRAGRMDKDQFTGALVIDDPIKPNDALSKPIRESINRTFSNTVKSRLATEDVPIIVIMQRVHEDDLTGFLLKGGSNEMWHHLEIPAHVNANSTPYPKNWTCGIPIPFDIPAGPLWEFKHNRGELKALKKADPFVWSSQYQQRPTAVGSTVFNRDWFPLYQSFNPINMTVLLEDGRLVRVKYINSYSDTAMKTGQHNDFSVFQTWAKGEDGRLYLLERIRDKWDAVDLERQFRRYLKRLAFRQGVWNMGPRAVKVEDKASGTGLIQSLNRKIGLDEDLKGLPKVTGIQRDRDKVARAMSAAPEVQKGLVVLPENAVWLEEFLDEVVSFSPAMTHKHDDQLDPMLDAVHEMLIENTFFDYNDVLGV